MRRERVKKAKELIDGYNAISRSARLVADWMGRWRDVQFWRGFYEEAEEYHQKCGTICDIEKECTNAASDLCRRFQDDLVRNIQYSPRF